jgi:hypothetical protein
MAYAEIGSTVVGTHPFCVQGIAAGATANAFWVWPSTYLQAELGTSDFINDGKDMGMNVGDVILAINTASGPSMHRVTAQGSTFTSLSLGNILSSAS